MARNYIEFWSGRLNISGNYFSVIAETRAECEAAILAAQGLYGGTIDWSSARGYFLINKSNMVGLLENWVTHYPSALGSTWIWFQDGLRAKESPRDTWSNGE